jgi:Holliday junction resolvase RusA-like endonuclease
MSRVPYTIEQLKKMGLVEKDGQYVQVKSLVAKKVEKLPSLIEQCKPFVDNMTETITKMQVIIDKSGPVFDNIKLQNRITELNAQEAFDLFNRTGFMFVKPNPIEQFLLPDGTHVDVLYRFDIEPCPAPRMTQSDKWKTDPYHTDQSKRQRKPVAQYFAFRDKLLSLCQENGYKLTNTLNILFIVPFPKSYSKKKREQLNNHPHDQKPDIDNFCKCWMDSLSSNDCKVWNIRAIKLWGYKGQIIIF